MGRSPVLATATVMASRPTLMANPRPAAGSMAPGCRPGPLAMGSCTVTSLVPSGKVASTCTSGISSATPSMTSSGPSRVAP